MTVREWFGDKSFIELSSFLQRRGCSFSDDMYGLGHSPGVKRRSRWLDFRFCFDFSGGMNRKFMLDAERSSAKRVEWTVRAGPKTGWQNVHPRMQAGFPFLK